MPTENENGLETGKCRPAVIVIVNRGERACSWLSDAN